jgi:type II secretory pathway pseudopilin PulG
MFPSKKGITLVEILVAGTIAAIFAAGSLSALAFARKYILDNSKQLEALYLCQETIESLKSQAYPPAAGAADVVTLGTTAYTRTPSVQDKNPEGKALSVTVEWIYQGKNYSETLTTLYANPN